MEVIGYLYTINCLVTHTLQNIFFCVQKKEKRDGFEQTDGQ